MFAYNYIIPSTIDEIGKVSASIFVPGCNFNCHYCHSSKLKNLKDGRIPDGEVINSIKKSEIIDCVLISGGEPFLREGLTGFVEKIKNERDIPIYINTNGYFPEKIREILHLVNGINMDIKTRFEKYIMATGMTIFDENIKKSIIILITETKKRPDFKLEFRTTMLTPFANQDDVKKIASYLKTLEFNGYYALQQFEKDNTMKMKMEAFNYEEMKKTALEISDLGFKVILRTGKGIERVNFKNLS